MRAQAFDSVEVSRKLGFGQGGVHLLVADLVQQNRGTALATFEFWDQMVQAAGPVRDRAVAERADRIAVRHHRNTVAAERK